MAIVTGDSLGSRMSGPAIRAIELARVLSGELEVKVASTHPAARTAPAQFPNVDVDVMSGVDRPRLRELASWADVIVFQGYLLQRHPWLTRADKVLVADLYDPFYLEQLEFGRADREPQRSWDLLATLSVVTNQLRRADFFICASERQRDFWMGHLAAVGRINARTYDQDPRLRRLIDVVPFGVPGEPPARAGSPIRTRLGLSADDRVLLWGGGLYPWFDLNTLIRAVARVAPVHPTVRLVLPGGRHPNTTVPDRTNVAEGRELAASLNILGSHVRFLEEWIPYEERGAALLDADIGVSTNHDRVETDYSFRTRILDYIWAGLPVLTTAGDTLADLVAREGLGFAVAPGNVDQLAHALAELVDNAELRARCTARSASVSQTLTWDHVARPLVDFCTDPAPAADRTNGRGQYSAASPFRRTTLMRRDLGRLIETYRQEGAAAAIHRGVARVRGDPAQVEGPE